MTLMIFSCFIETLICTNWYKGLTVDILSLNLLPKGMDILGTVGNACKAGTWAEPEGS